MSTVPFGSGPLVKIGACPPAVVLVSWNNADKPATPAVIEKLPGAEFASSEAAVATPAALEIATEVARFPGKAADAAAGTTLNRIVVPAIGTPAPSRTTAWSAVVNGEPTTVLCGVPATGVSVAG